MKQPPATSLIFFCFVSAVFFSFKLHADTIEVTSPQKIQTAILHAKPFDVVVLNKGKFIESNIAITKPLTITGKQGAEIDGNGEGNIFAIEAHSVTISNITFTNTGYSSMQEYAAVKLLSSKYCVVENNRINDCTFGVYLSASSNCVVKNNSIHAANISEQRSGNGIHLWQSDSITISGNSVSGHRDGIYFEFVTHTGVYNNISSHNLRYGIHFMFSNNDEYENNEFFYNGAGVAVMFSKFVSIRKNTFAYSEGGASYGILLKEINDCIVSQNKFLHNTTALFLEGCNRLLIEKNYFQSNGWANQLQASCYETTYTQNIFTGNTFDLATSGTLQAFSISGNYWDRYEGYDLDKNSVGDVPYYPVSMYAMITERAPYAILLYRSFMVYLLDRAEKVMPGITPVNMKDDNPLMQEPIV